MAVAYARQTCAVSAFGSNTYEEFGLIRWHALAVAPIIHLPSTRNLPEPEQRHSLEL